MAHMSDLHADLTVQLQTEQAAHQQTKRDLEAAQERITDLELAIEDVLAWFDAQPDALRWSEPAETLREARYGVSSVAA